MGYWYQDTTNSTIGHTAAWGYDSLDRLSSATVAPLQQNGPESYTQNFSYDRYGNGDCSGSGTCTAPIYNAGNQVSSWAAQAATDQ